MNTRNKIDNIRIEGAKIILKNFSGNKKDYNEDGKRYFGLVIPNEEYAEILMEEGWNIKRTRPSEEAPDGVPWLKVNVKFENIPPIVQLITGEERIRLDEDTIDQLDWSQFKNVDIIVNPYVYKPFGSSQGGISAYLKAMYVTLEEDDFSKKYKDIPFKK